jgi:hypothetical protein
MVAPSVSCPVPTTDCSPIVFTGNGATLHDVTLRIICEEVHADASQAPQVPQRCRRTDGLLRPRGRKTMHRAIAEHGLAELRGIDGHAIDGGSTSGEKVISQVVGKGLAGKRDERAGLVIDGIVPGPPIEFTDPARLHNVRPCGNVAGHPSGRA